MLLAVLAEDAKDLGDIQNLLTAIGVEAYTLETLTTVPIDSMKMVIVKDILKNQVGPSLLIKIPQRTGLLRVYAVESKK